jgi:hypothetical protein
MALQYMTWVNSKNPADLQKAYDFIEVERNALAQALGKETPDHDPLAAYPDLQKAFEEGNITRELALEVASTRHQQRLSSGLNEQTQQQTRHQQAREAALKDLTALGNELQKDPHFEYKKPAIQSITETVLTTEKDPSKWSDLIRRNVQNLPNPPAIETPRKTQGKPNPIRPGSAGPAGGNLAKQPGSAFEAVDMMLDSL